MGTSELPGFYRLGLGERRRAVGEHVGLDSTEMDALGGEGGLTDHEADRMVENAIGVMGLPLGVCANLRLDGEDVLVPMAIEEPSVIAAASHGAKLLRPAGGVTSHVGPAQMIGQIQLLDVPDPAGAMIAIRAAAPDLVARANAGHARLLAAGGGVVAVEVLTLPPQDDPIGPMVVVHLVIDVRDAMGANTVNAMCEDVGPAVAALARGRLGVRILSNLADRRLVRAQGSVGCAELAGDRGGGADLARRIEEASVFAERDPYRAATHNKGIMNGVEAVLVAFGQDWRAVSAGAHAFAARGGRYTALARWRVRGDHLVGELELPLAVGVVGGVARVHPTVAVCRKIAGIASAGDLARRAAAIGLCQNLAALRALADEGIQRGHMRLHARNLAVEAGARPHEVAAVVRHLARAGPGGLAGARAALAELRAQRAGAPDRSLGERLAALRAAHLPAVRMLLEPATANRPRCSRVDTDPTSPAAAPAACEPPVPDAALDAALPPLLVADVLGDPPEPLLPLAAACALLQEGDAPRALALLRDLDAPAGTRDAIAGMALRAVLAALRPDLRGDGDDDLAAVALAGAATLLGSPPETVAAVAQAARRPRDATARARLHAREPRLAALIADLEELRRGPAPASASDQELCAALLPEVSRTFALSIAALPVGLREAVTAGYLVCRIVDTIEDDPKLLPAVRRVLFDRFDAALRGAPVTPLVQTARACELGATDAERRLAAGARAVFALLGSLPAARQAAIREAVLRMSAGMRSYAERAVAESGLRLRDLADLEQYCYFVAGTVGELLTTLFEPAAGGLPEPARAEIRARAARFGIGLQLVNVLRDIGDDLANGACYLPVGLARAHGLEIAHLLEPEHRGPALAVVRAVAARARRHLEDAIAYTLAWPVPAAGHVRQFCAVPLALALATLAEIEGGKDTLRPGIVPKISRAAVASLVAAARNLACDDAALTAMLRRAGARPAGREVTDAP